MMIRWKSSFCPIRFGCALFSYDRLDRLPPVRLLPPPCDPLRWLLFDCVLLCGARWAGAELLRPLLRELCGGGPGRELLCFCTGVETTWRGCCLVLLLPDLGCGSRTPVLIAGDDPCLALLFLVPGCGCRTGSLTAGDDRCVTRFSVARVCDCRDEAVVARDGLCLALFSRGWAGSRRVLSLAVDCAVCLTFLSLLARSTFCLTSGLLFRGTGVARFFLPLDDKSLRLMTSFRSRLRSAPR